MRAWRSRSCQVVAGGAACLALAACGSGQRQDAHEPKGRFPVDVATASFPGQQRLAQQSHLVIAVRNAGHATIPDVAVTICNVTCTYPAPAGEGSSAQAFAADLNQSGLANPSRPLWIVDQGPGSCSAGCATAGQGGAVTAYANTWALGSLRPGATARFAWAVTAVQAGRHVIAWEIAAGLNGRARAVAARGSATHGTFAVHVSSAPAQTYVNNNGQVVTTG